MALALRVGFGWAGFGGVIWWRLATTNQHVVI